MANLYKRGDNYYSERNPTGVGMKLGDISALDQESTGPGVAGGNRLEPEIWV